MCIFNYCLLSSSLCNFQSERIEGIGGCDNYNGRQHIGHVYTRFQVSSRNVHASCIEYDTPGSVYQDEHQTGWRD